MCKEHERGAFSPFSPPCRPRLTFFAPSSLFTTQANDFYVKTETKIRGQLDILEEEIKHEKTDVERFKSAKKQIVKHFAPELSELRSFVILNYTAVVKAVKKYNKNCNKRENAVEIIRDVPMFVDTSLAEVVTRTELLAARAAPAEARQIEDRICSVCDDVMTNPVRLACRHRFCFKCVVSSDARQPESFNHGLTTKESSSTLSALTSAYKATQRVCFVPDACPLCKARNAKKANLINVDSYLDDFIAMNFPDEEDGSPYATIVDEVMQKSTGDGNTNPAESLVAAVAVGNLTAQTTSTANHNSLSSDEESKRNSVDYSELAPNRCSMSDEGGDTLIVEMPTTMSTSPQQKPFVARSSPNRKAGLHRRVDSWESDRFKLERESISGSLSNGNGRPSSRLNKHNNSNNNNNTGHHRHHRHHPDSDSAQMPKKKKLLRKVLVIAIAGCRSDAMMIANTPTFKSFIRGNKNGCFSLDMTVSAMRASKSPSSAMLPALTGQSVSVLKDIVEDHDATLTGVFARLHLARPWANCASAVGGAKDLHKIIAKEAIALVSVGATDSEATRAIIQQLAVPEKALDDGKDETTPDALFLHMADVQTAGHVHGFGPHVEEYLHAIENADKRVSAVLEALRKRQETIKNEDWLVMVTSPSGGTCRNDMPASMQAMHDASDWSQGGGRQLRANGVSGMQEVSQHASGWVLIESGIECKLTGEILPSPQDTDISPTILEHFGVVSRKEWKMDGGDMLNIRRAEFITNMMRDSEQLSENGDEPDEDFGARHPRARSRTTPGHGHHGSNKSKSRSRTQSPKPFVENIPGLYDPIGCAVIGHRGVAMNHASGPGIRENTLLSFTQAHKDGAEWCEFDVQVTSDGVPVVWHDDVVLVKRGDGPIDSFSVREIEWADLKELSMAAKITSERLTGKLPMPRPRKKSAELEDDESYDEPDDDEDDDEDDLDPVVFYRVFDHEHSIDDISKSLPWIMEDEDVIPTLSEVLANTPEELGFNIELKYDEHNSCEAPRLVAELRSILAACSEHNDRRIVFSSFDPDAATLMRALQGTYPVMILTDGEENHDDPRRRSVEAAMKVALKGGLCGVVADVARLVENPKSAELVKDSGLLLASYGSANDESLVGRQVEWGASGIITDRVGGVYGERNDEKTRNLTRRQPKFKPSETILDEKDDVVATFLPKHGSSQTFQGVPTIIEEDQDGLKRIHSTLNAASAAEMLQKLELDTVMLSEWYKLSDDQGRKNFENSNASKRDSMDDFSDLSTQDAIKGRQQRHRFRGDDGQTMHAPRKSVSDQDINVRVYSPSRSPEPQLPPTTNSDGSTTYNTENFESYLVGVSYTEAQEKKRKEKERWSQYPQYTKKGVGKNGTRYQNGDKSKEETTKVLTGFQPANKIVPRVV